MAKITITESWHDLPESHCDSCDMRFYICWNRNPLYSQIEYCPFCGGDVDEVEEPYSISYRTPYKAKNLYHFWNKMSHSSNDKDLIILLFDKEGFYIGSVWNSSIKTSLIAYKRSLYEKNNKSKKSFEFFKGIGSL